MDYPDNPFLKFFIGNLMIKKLALAAVLAISSADVFATVTPGGPNQRPTSAPEIDGGFAVLSLSMLGGILALMLERGRK